MIWSKQRFQHCLELYPRVLKEVAPLLLPISLLIWGLEFYVSWLNKARFENPYESSMVFMASIGLIGVILQSLASVIWVLYVSRSTQRQMKNGAGPHPFSFLRQHFHQSLIESVRALISVGIYAVFFILPALYRWVQMIFVVLISAFDPEYLKGKKDALLESKRLVKGAFFPLLALILLQSLIPMTIEETAKSSGLSFTTPIFYLTSWLLTLFLAIYFSLTFFARHSFVTEKN